VYFRFCGWRHVYSSAAGVWRDSLARRVGRVAADCVSDGAPGRALPAG